MESQDNKLIVVFFTIALTLLIAGCLFVPFVVHIWTYIANLAGEKDTFLASTLLAYVLMSLFFGAGLGLALYHYGVKCCKEGCPLTKKIMARLTGHKNPK